MGTLATPQLPLQSPLPVFTLLDESPVSASHDHELQIRTPVAHEGPFVARVNGPAEPRPRQRSPRRGSTPTCSIVVVGSGDPDAIGSCMTRLGDACRRFGAEIIIVVPGSESDVAAIRRTFPFARIVAAPADLRPDELRGLGLQEAGGDIVAFTHDCATHGEEWIGVLERRARNEGGYGPVPNGKMDWARYLADRGLLFGNGRSK